MPDADLVIYRASRHDQAGRRLVRGSAVAIDYAAGIARRPTRVLRATALPPAVLTRFALEGEVVAERDLLMDIANLGGVPHLTVPNLAPGCASRPFC